MKAAEYYAKYKARLWTKDEVAYRSATADLMLDMVEDFEELIKTRNAVRDSAVKSAINEINQRYNMVCSRFERDFGASPIKRDGFKKLIMDQLEKVKEEREGKKT